MTPQLAGSRKALGLTLGVLLSLPLTSLAAAATDSTSTQVDMTDRLIIKYRIAADSRTAAERISRERDMAARSGLAVQRSHRNALGADILKLDRKLSVADAAQLAQDITRNDPTVEYAEPDRIMHPMFTPTAGNPFTFASGRDQYLACYGIAGRIPSNCNDISDYNDKQMCFGLSMRSQNACTTMTDRNMQLACYGMSIDYPSNCRDITDANMRNLCYAESSHTISYCHSVTDRNTQLLCYAISNGISSNCRDITNANDRQFCYAISSQNNGYCADIRQ